ncbi:hypothetical protein BBJ29_003598 [Phytophthora kernoviae]|uniref:Uncharacterized protein n=1 Tax=Phytophthora kernoviae TaxID=325452 RepID=A0A3F2RRQ9_9STRA|nr:hypothetical protein BBP00_00004417 [Phytophthora kernoviae]RLN65487.1 hypothetical protein BBJ29_003598 [Phytophthora kernoviae]
MNASSNASLSPSLALIIHPLYPTSTTSQSSESLAVAELLRSLHPSPPPSPSRKTPLCLLDFACDETIHHVLSFLDGVSLEFHVSPTQLSTQPESYQKLYQFASRSLKMLLRDYLHEQCLTNLQNSLHIPRAAALTLITSRTAV